MAHGPPSSPPTVAGYKWKGCKGHFSCTGAVGVQHVRLSLQSLWAFWSGSSTGSGCSSVDSPILSSNILKLMQSWRITSKPIGVCSYKIWHRTGQSDWLWSLLDNPEPSSWTEDWYSWGYWHVLLFMVLWPPRWRGSLQARALGFGADKHRTAKGKGPFITLRVYN